MRFTIDIETRRFGERITQLQSWQAPGPYVKPSWRRDGRPGTLKGWAREQRKTWPGDCALCTTIRAWFKGKGQVL